MLWGANEVWRRGRYTSGESRENESICYDNHISMMDHVPLVLAGRDEQGAGPVSCLGRWIWEPLLFAPGVSAVGQQLVPNVKPLAQHMCQHENTLGTLVLHTKTMITEPPFYSAWTWGLLTKSSSVELWIMCCSLRFLLDRISNILQIQALAEEKTITFQDSQQSSNPTVYWN